MALLRYSNDCSTLPVDMNKLDQAIPTLTENLIEQGAPDQLKTDYVDAYQNGESMDDIQVKLNSYLNKLFLKQIKDLPSCASETQSSRDS